ncbi:putative carbonyl reductase [Ilyonectria robusta]|uniref:putative carbonyl reductase n=1 Tax=Ilyonectria robusta TaxID=1079257 RepID=UPI001E8E37DB|nr:putative carbonyl reductase [Ilyonectria robusta]KAH8654352.1 putative carbonyl reductase [Ilyonectria robusta]
MEPFRKKFSVEKIPDLAGKVIIVTGGATGIGKQTVIQLLRCNAKVYVASRSKSKFEQLLDSLATTDVHMVTGMKFLEIDLSDMGSCISAAKRFAELEDRLDILIANAALSVVPETLSKDGIEIQFAYLGHFVIVYSLLSLIQHTAQMFGEARIVIVASHAHAMYKPISKGKIDFESLGMEGSKTIENFAEVQASLQRYGRSKLANILFARYLYKHLQATGHANILVNCLNPGTIGTAPGTDSAALPPMFSYISSSIVRWTSIPPEDGALTTLLLATDPEIKSKALNGRYFDVGPLAGKFYYGYSWDATDSKLSDLAKDEQLAETLWDWSLRTLRTKKEGFNQTY